MKKTAFLLFTISLLVSTSAHAKWNPKHAEYLLNNANTALKNGDFIFAARAFDYIYSNSSDDKMKAESMYKFAKCGREMEKILTNRGVYSLLDEDNRDTEWKKRFESLIQNDMKLLEESKINVYRHGHYLLPPYVSKPYISMRQVADTYPNTRWGELAFFDLITWEAGNDGNNIVGPKEVVTRGEKFLSDYPKSEYVYDVYIQLARGYNDLWNFTQDEEYKNYMNKIIKEYLDDPDLLRKSAIKYFEKAKTNIIKLKTEKWNTDYPEFDKVLSDLKKGNETHVYYYFSD